MEVIIESQKQLGWKWLPEMAKSNPPCSDRGSWSRLSRTTSSQVLCLSKDGDATTSLGNLFQCLMASYCFSGEFTTPSCDMVWEGQRSMERSTPNSAQRSRCHQV